MLAPGRWAEPDVECVQKLVEESHAIRRPGRRAERSAVEVGSVGLSSQVNPGAHANESACYPAVLKENMRVFNQRDVRQREAESFPPRRAKEKADV
jgi:hypothetical protein